MYVLLVSSLFLHNPNCTERICRLLHQQIRNSICVTDERSRSTLPHRSVALSVQHCCRWAQCFVDVPVATCPSMLPLLPMILRVQGVRPISMHHNARILLCPEHHFAADDGLQEHLRLGMHSFRVFAMTHDRDGTNSPRGVSQSTRHKLNHSCHSTTLVLTRATLLIGREGAFRDRSCERAPHAGHDTEMPDPST